jgi:transcriptional regulator with XRE-family HTH domain
MPQKPDDDPAMTRVRARFERSGLSLHELGLKMGYPEATARQSAWQFMKTSDPRVSTLRRFARALGVSIEELVGEEKQEGLMSTKEIVYLHKKSVLEAMTEKRRKGEEGYEKRRRDAFNEAVAAWNDLSDAERASLQRRGLAPAQNQPELRETGR